MREDNRKARWIRSLQDAGLSYGIDVLGEFTDASGLDDAERWAIAYARNSGWNLTNLTDGGDGQSLGYKPSETARKKVSAALRGKPKSKEHAAKVGASHKGKRLSDETKEKLRAANLGKKYQQELRQRLSDLRSGHGSKLTHDQVREIRSRYVKRANGGLAPLAKEFGVFPSTINRIVKRKTFKNVL